MNEWQGETEVLGERNAGSKARLALKADNLTAIWETIV
jgi:hypothetical protein